MAGFIITPLTTKSSISSKTNIEWMLLRPLSCLHPFPWVDYSALTSACLFFISWNTKTWFCWYQQLMMVPPPRSLSTQPILSSGINESMQPKIWFAFAEIHFVNKRLIVYPIDLLPSRNMYSIIYKGHLLNTNHNCLWLDPLNTIFGYWIHAGSLYIFKQNNIYCIAQNQLAFKLWSMKQSKCQAFINKDTDIQ